MLPKINIERLKNREGLSNTAIACLLLGWQGGTVHQVSEKTGLTVEQIIDSHNIDSLISKAMQLQSRREFFLKQSNDFLNNSVFSIQQSEKDAKKIEQEIKAL